MVTDQFPGHDDDEVDVSRGPVSIEKLRGRYFDEATGTFRKPVSPEEANAEFMARLAQGAKEMAAYCERNGAAIREAYEKMGAGSGSDYEAAVRLIESVGKGGEDPKVARDWILNWRRANKLTQVETRRLLKQLQGVEDTEKEAESKPVRRCPPPKSLLNMPSAALIELRRGIARGQEGMRERIEAAARHGQLRKGERRILLSWLDTQVAELHAGCASGNKNCRDELFVEAAMGVRGEEQKPKLFRRPVASERKENPRHSGALERRELPKAIGAAREGIVVVNTSAGIRVCRQR